MPESWMHRAHKKRIQVVAASPTKTLALLGQIPIPGMRGRGAMTAHERRELEPPAAPLKRGDTGPKVRQVQEWLTLNGYGTAVDGDFGPATEAALKAFQQCFNIQEHEKGQAGSETWDELVEMLRRAVEWKLGWPREAKADVAACASVHLVSRPREVGGPNAGPWVRYYCRGQEVPWCAGFATTVLGQAMGHDEWYTLSCDELAAKAHARGLLVHQPPKDWQTQEHIKPGDLFLIRRTVRWPHDWVHCGIVTSVGDGYFETIEGNTNMDGRREGTGVCKRVRAFNARTDFVLMGEGA